MVFSQLKNDIRFQMRAISTLAKYVNFECQKMNKFRDRLKDRDEVYGLRDNILTLMDSLLFKCLDQKLMVLLWTDMVPEHAFLLVPICVQLRTQLAAELLSAAPRQRVGGGTLSLLNAAVLMLNRWRQMFRNPNNVETFYAQTDLVFVQLEHMRTSLLENATDDCNEFYKFLPSFRQMPLK